MLHKGGAEAFERATLKTTGQQPNVTASHHKTRGCRIASEQGVTRKKQFDPCEIKGTNHGGGEKCGSFEN